MTKETGSALIPASFMSFDEACKAIACIENMDEVKEWRSRAAAFDKYAAAAKNYDLEIQAYEIKERAERRAGQLLKEIIKTGRPKENGTTVVPFSRLNITKNESSRWQQKADISDLQFEEALRKAKEGRRPNRSVIPEVVRKLREGSKNVPPSPIQAAPIPPVVTLLGASSNMLGCIDHLKRASAELKKALREDLPELKEEYQKTMMVKYAHQIINEANRIIQVVKPAKTTLKAVEDSQ